MKTFIVTVSQGKATFVYDDDLVGLLNEGRAEIRRASHVEPTGEGGWSADMTPVGGPVLGPFPLRQEALAAEVSWIRANVL